MAIKKCFVFLFIFVLISSFVFPAFAADTPYFYPDDSELVQLKENSLFNFECTLPNASSNYIGEVELAIDFQYDADVQYYIYYQVPSGSYFIPVNCMYQVYYGAYAYCFGLDIFVDDDVSFDIFYDLGFVLISPPNSDSLILGVVCDPLLSNQFGTFGLTYLEKEPLTISDRVNQGILLVVELLGTFVSSFFARSGDLYPLLQLLLLGISVSVLVWVARAIKIFIWGY